MTIHHVEESSTPLPPVTQLAVGTLVLVVAGGVYMASQIGHPATLVPAVILAIAAAVLLVINVVGLLNVREFAWNKFFLVSGWALVAYLVIAGMIEFSFVYDHIPGRQLALFTAMLIIFAINIPLLLGFSVARYQEPTRRSIRR